MSTNQQGEQKLFHWAFSAAKKTMEEHGEQELYTCASGITPSGTIHVGNFREFITVDLVKRAFIYMGKNARHIHSWDDYDVFRKVPKNMPQPEILKEHLRMSIVDVPDTTGKHTSYADKNREEMEQVMPLVGVKPTLLRQAEKYRASEYAEDMNTALEQKSAIKEILDGFRKEPLAENWLPIMIFDNKSRKDTITEAEYRGDYKVWYKSEEGNEEEVDLRECSNIKLNWRIDWPMRWNFENVHFEPGGKDHSSQGGSYDTGKPIAEKIWNKKAPTYIMYDFISIKGKGGKISSSTGEVVTVADLLEIYQPEIIRYLFAGTRPNTEFAISFDMDVIKIYEDFDKCERTYYGKEGAQGKEFEKQKLIYQFSQVEEDLEKIPKELPLQIPFRTLISDLNLVGMDEEKVMEKYREQIKSPVDEERLKVRISCSKNWLNLYAEEDMKYSINSEKNKEFFSELDEKQKQALEKLREVVQEWEDLETMESKIFNIPKSLDLPMKDFFALCYQALISRNKGPKLARFISDIGKEKVLDLI